jgi:hypothetical protein
MNHQKASMSQEPIAVWCQEHNGIDVLSNAFSSVDGHVGQMNQGTNHNMINEWKQHLNNNMQPMMMANQNQMHNGMNNNGMNNNGMNK